MKKHIIFAIGSIAACLLLVVGIPLYAAGTLSADFGKHIEFKPLVRHMMSQLHCYDAGTDDCEMHNHLGTTFSKEHTLGFILDGSRYRVGSLGLKPLYVCESENGDGTMMVTAGTTEDDPKDACRDADYDPDHIGYISPTDELEVSTALYRCVHPETHDTLLTQDPNECSAALYGAAELLGYIYTGGPLAGN